MLVIQTKEEEALPRRQGRQSRKDRKAREREGREWRSLEEETDEGVEENRLFMIVSLR